MVEYITVGKFSLEVFMGISLISDFSDYYDHALSSSGKSYTFNRMSSRVPRVESLRYLSENSQELLFESVVEHGPVSDFAGNYPDETEIVVYRDGLALNGLGLLRMPISKALKSHPDGYCALFVEGRGSSLKHLVVGTTNYLFVRKSATSWKSNTGEVAVKLVASWNDAHHRHFPLYSVSYILAAGSPVAIHLDTAPRLKGLVDENPQVIGERIRDWFSDKGEH